jgi:dolichyl-phosphate-mannose--protein O-mannosyl transferase
VEGAPAPADTRLRRRDLALLLLITLVAFGLRAWRLDFPDKEYFDETYYTKAALNYLRGEPDSNTVHPPLGKECIALGMRLVNEIEAMAGRELLDVPGEARVAPLLAGTAMIPLVYLLGLRLGRGSRLVAGSAAFLVAIDFLHLVQSRIAMLDIFLAFFCLLGLWFTWLFLEDAEVGRPRRWAWVVLAALSFGAATACKWNGIFGGFGACLLMMMLGRPADPPSDTRRQRLLRWLLPPLIFLVLVPPVYLASYLPLFRREGFKVQTLRTIYGYHENMVRFRYDPNQFKHRYLSYWWGWPVVYRPIWYYYEEAAPQATAANPNPAKAVYGIVAMGSVLFWWTSLIYIGELGFYGVRYRDRRCLFLLVLYLSQWLLWAISTTGGFIFYMLPDVPLMALAAGLVLEDWRGSRGGAWMIASYLVAVLVVFALYYPYLTAYPASKPLFDRLFMPASWK